MKTKPSPEVAGRREFIGRCASAFAGLTLVGLVAPVLGSCEPTALPVVPSGGGNNGGNNTADGIPFDVSALDADGKAVATTIKGPDNFPILIARRSATVYTALSMRCTHEAQKVSGTVPIGGPITCPFHGSLFALDGTVTRGPAATALREYPTTYDAAARIVRIKVT